MTGCLLNHFHYFYLLIHDLKWYVGESCDKDSLKKRIHVRAMAWSISVEQYDYGFYTELEVPKYQTPTSCEQGFKDVIESFMDTRVPSGYNFSCANLKECSNTSYTELFDVNTMTANLGSHKGKSLQYFIDKKFPKTRESVQLITPKKLRVKYGKTELPSIF